LFFIIILITKILDLVLYNEFKSLPFGGQLKNKIKYILFKLLSPTKRKTHL
jgi:hypothetical protein